MITVIVVTIDSLVIIATLLIVLWQKGMIVLNNPQEYEVKGIDVSEYQGEIDWEILSKEGIDFAFIKATEGSFYQDSYFLENYKEARKTNLTLGVYHFFSFESTGIQQANNFIKAIGNLEEQEILLPIVDVEFYQKEKPEINKVKEELENYLIKIEEQYGIQPIIYTTQEAYKLLIEDDFKNYDLWIRNVFRKPQLKDEEEWTFWQYADKGKLQGYQGQEEFIDLNVFKGSKEEFKQYVENKMKKRKIKIETKSIDGIITKIEGNTLFIENQKQEIKKVNWENTKIINNRTGKEILLQELKEQDKIQISNVIDKEDEYFLLEESNASVIRNLKGEELKQEMLNANYICMSIEKLTNYGKSIDITGKMTDYYSEYEQVSFEIQVEVNDNTQIFSETKNQWEELQKIKERGDAVYVEFRENEKEQGKLVAKNIEVMGC